MSSANECAGTLECTKRKKLYIPMSEIGVKSASASYGGTLSMVGTADIAVLVPKNSVAPSGGALVTTSAAITPSAPGRFSTATGWPSDCERGCTTMRATASAVPPGGKGTIRRTGLLGYCPAAGAAESSRAQNATDQRPSFCINCSSDYTRRSPTEAKLGTTTDFWACHSG